MSDTARLLLCLGVSGLGMACLQRVAMSLAFHAQAERGRELLRFRGWAGPLSPLGDALAVMVGVQIAALFLLVTARPVAATVLVVAVGALLVVLNRCKETILHEPLVLADAWLLGQVFRYPHLYLPFFPVKMISLAGAVLGANLLLFLPLEPGVDSARTLSGGCFLLLAATLPVVCVMRMCQGGFPAFGDWLLRHCPVGYDAVRDAALHGPLASAVLHPVGIGKIVRESPDFINDFSIRPKASSWPESLQRFLDTPHAEAPVSRRGQAPHVVMVQAESFADIRAWMPEAQRAALAGLLPAWGALCAKGRALPTPESAFGAYTMRTEFSMLTGLGAETLGPLWYNPYLLAARRPLWSLARHFVGQGYDTLCVHPYATDFFGRDAVMPNLGFQRFLGMDALQGLERFGPYTSDKALGECIVAELRQSTRPVFCFVITMEAHGPWLPGRLTEEEIAATLHDVGRTLFTHEQQLYLCHLRHMDAMLGMLDGALEPAPECAGCPPGSAGELSRPGLVWAYGDHVPGGGMMYTHSYKGARL